MSNLTKVKLKGIRVDVDFRFSELTNYQEYTHQKNYPGELKSGEAFLFISRSLKQLVWVLGCHDLQTGNVRGKSSRFLIDTRRWRIEGGEWNPYMLQNYAHMAGIQLFGRNGKPLKKFEEIFNR